MGRCHAPRWWRPAARPAVKRAPCLRPSPSRNRSATLVALTYVAARGTSLRGPAPGPPCPARSSCRPPSESQMQSNDPSSPLDDLRRERLGGARGRGRPRDRGARGPLRPPLRARCLRRRLRGRPQQRHLARGRPPRACRSSPTSTTAAPAAPRQESGDGAGVLVQLPHAFFLRECSELGLALPGAGPLRGRPVLPAARPRDPPRHPPRLRARPRRARARGPGLARGAHRRRDPGRHGPLRRARHRAAHRARAR